MIDLSPYLPKVRIQARTVWNQYRHYIRDYMEFDDLYHIGVLGLMRAAKRWVPGGPANLWTYAEYRVRGTMVDYLRDDPALPRVARKTRVTPKMQPEPLDEDMPAIEQRQYETIDRNELIRQMILHKQRAGAYTCDS